jgi:CRP-like cAMP-binding protein
VKFWLDDFARHQDIESDILKRLWYALKREGIQIPFPIRDVYHHKGDVFTDAVTEHMEMLKDIEFLKVLTDDQMRQLARRLDPLIFARGETICRQGEAGETFYIVKSGAVEVSAYNGQGYKVMLRRMGPGDFFGEISLMTGEPRSATVSAVEDTEVLMMDKEDMRYLLEENSQLAEHVSGILAVRQQHLEEQRTQQRLDVSSSGEIRHIHVESLRREFLGRIRRFFAY